MKAVRSKLLILIILITCIFKAGATKPPFLNLKNDEWVNQKISQLSLEEKIAQLMMITVYPKQNDVSKAIYLNRIKKYKPGGILVMQGTPQKTAAWINEFQSASDTPLLVAIDGEWGPAMRIDSTIVYPYAQTLGAISDSAILYRMGRDYAAQLKALGIHINFAPVADINTNPSNPVINFRSFGEDKQNVAEKAWMVAKGMQDAGIIAVAKHFPGHGDTKTDSHHTLPLVPHPKRRIDKVESFPFRYLTQKGITGIMTGHLSIPSLDESGKTSSLSKKVVSDYLKNEIGFEGLVVTDAITMKGVKAAPGQAELEALIAGNDMVEFVPDLEVAINAIKSGISANRISEEEINEKCRKVLALKRWTGLKEYKPAPLTKLTEKLNSPEFEVTERKLIQGTMTVLTNNNALPIQKLEDKNIASIMIGGNSKSSYQKILERYTRMDHYYLPKGASEKDWMLLRQKLSNYNLIIAGVDGINKYPSKKYGTTALQRRAVSELVIDNNSIVTFFGNAYALKHFPNIQHAKGLILAHQNTKLTKELAAQLIFGAFSANGHLPVTVDQRFKLNDGLEVKKNACFSYTIPEEAGLNSKKLHSQIDSIAQLGLTEKAYPGCQVLIARDGQVVFHKCYGFHTYDSIQKVSPDNIYDWASVTKVTGPLPALMKLVDEKKINIDAKFSEYWPNFKGSNKEKLKFREVLAHQARLASWIPYWTMALDENGTLDKKIFKDHPSRKFNIRISDHLFMNEAFKKIMFDTIRTSELEKRKHYLYSGLSHYLYPDIITNITGVPYDKYITETFYKPLGAYTITHNAYKHFPLNRIIPTETDDFFRMEKLHGFVHDEGAAMMGGISGNAGLFGTTNDLAKVFQMYLQKGYFGGRRYISETTVNEFIKIQYPGNDNRRGLGFDKPLIDNCKNKLEDAYPAVSASKSSFGHSGYTGTFAWADPEAGILFIFMSNRVCPSRENGKLYQLNIRTAMHQAVYDSLLN